MSQLQLQSHVVFFQAPPLGMVEMIESPALMDSPFLEADLAPISESQIKSEFKQRVMGLLTQVGPVYAQAPKKSPKQRIREMKLAIIYNTLNGLVNHLDGVWVGSMEFEIMGYQLAECQADFKEICRERI